MNMSFSNEISILQIEIIAKGESKFSDIAIDDLSLVPGECVVNKGEHCYG